jgi:hypothetical protein
MADESRSVDDDFFDKGIISLCNTCNGTPDAPHHRARHTHGRSGRMIETAMRLAQGRAPTGVDGLDAIRVPAQQIAAAPRDQCRPS